jgi:MFS family permease
MRPEADILARARIGAAAIFLLLGLGMGLWVVHIPVVQKDLALSDGVLGIALFAVVAGAIASMPLSGWAATVRGSRPVVRLTTVIFCIGLALPLFAPTFLLLLASGFVLGFGMGGLDVSVNAQAVTVERRMRRPIMSSLHAFYSLGGLIGSAVGGFLLAQPWDPAFTLLAASALMLVVGVVAGRTLVPDGSATRPADEKIRTRDVLRLRVLALGGLAFLAFFSEGAIGDWSSIFLTRQTGATPAVAATGFVAFSITMTVSRFLGDRVVAALGPRPSLVWGGLLAFAGMVLALAVPNLVAGVIGFALMGVGFANIVPVLFSAAGRAGVSPSAGIAVVTMIAYGGLLIGPPLIGGLSELVGLSAALSVVAVFGLLLALGARVIPDR